MKRLMMVVAIVGMVSTLSAALTSEAGAPPDPLIGAWETDADDTYQRLMIGGGPGDHYHLVYFHHNHPACGGSQAIGIGMGDLMDDVLEAELSVRCLKSRTALDGWMPMFTYLADGDLLVEESSGMQWKRQGQNMWHPSGH